LHESLAPAPAQGRNLRTAAVCAGVVAAMVGLSFAAVPLYDAFCRVTGYGGATRVAEAEASRILDRDVTIRFDATVNGALPWAFRPDQGAVEVHVEPVHRAVLELACVFDRIAGGQGRRPA